MKQSTEAPPIRGLILMVVACAGMVAGCSSDAQEDLVPTGRDTASSAASAINGRPAATVSVDATPIATDLAAPWSVAFLPDGSALATERDEARVVHLTPQVGGTWQVEPAGEVAGVDNSGEGGLLGVAVAPGSSDVYLYWSTPSDNRVGRATWDGTSLSAPEVILDGIPHSDIHDGGRITFGPDGMLYIGTGDAANQDSAQDPASLAGKILRIAPDGSVPADNPTPGSPVYSTGHRNVQGLAFDEAGRLWASEFGAADVDELNLITAGGNYGWPQFEGPGGGAGLTDPAAAWSPTSVASPSGMAIAAGSAWVAGLRGETLWQVPLDGTTASTPIPHLAGDYGRLRDVVVAPDGSLWIITNNTDGRGSPGPDDDRILRVTVNG